MKIIRQFISSRVTTGGVLMAVGTGIAGLFPTLLVVGGPIFVVGLVITALGFFQLAPRKGNYHDKWDPEEVFKALKEIPPTGTVRILQTWLPDAETFVPELENLLTKGGKQFQLHIMLMDFNKATISKPDVLLARVKHRPEGRDDASARIKGTIDALIMMKSRVDDTWQRERNGATLDLQIRLYNFLPFGPIYQIGSVMFLGFYLNHSSSANAPMIKLTTHDSNNWTIFQQHFEIGWKDALPFEVSS